MKKLRYSRRLIAATAIIAGLGIGAIGIGSSFAASPTATPHQNGMEDLIQAIADKFQLNVSDVQAVFDAEKAKWQTQRAEHEADHLKQLVADGKLTQAQADAITAKRAELEADAQNGQKPDLATLKQWAKDNNIPLQYLLPGHGPGHMMHGRK